MKKIILILISIIAGVSIYLLSTSKQSNTPINEKEELRFKPAKFRTDTTFMCGANLSRETAKLYFDSNTLNVTFDNRSYISTRQAPTSYCVKPEITCYVTSDHYTNPNQLYMEVEEEGSSIRISGDSVDPKGIVYSCFEVDKE